MPNSSPVSGISDKKRKSLSTYWAAESAGPQTTIVVRPWALLPSSHGNSAGDAAGQRDAEEPPERLEAAIEPSPETAPEESAGRGVGCFEHMTQKIKERVIEHYTIPDSTPSMEEIEADRWVGFPPSIIVPRWGIQWYGHQLVQAKFARWMLLPAALVLQLCVGSFYAWSGYNAASGSDVSLSGQLCNSCLP